MSTYTVVIPEWENTYKKSDKTRPKYWLWKDKAKLPKKYLELLADTPIIIGRNIYCCSKINKELFLKNTKKAGKENRWVLNGQDLYSGIMDWRLRKSIALYFHDYFSKYITQQLTPIDLLQGEYLSISCDIYEIERAHMPDVSNMWILEKFFEDALQDCNIIADDGPKIVRESGRKKYIFVEQEQDRKLIFYINKIKN